MIQPTFSHQPRRQKGFTLIELLVVIVIIAVLASLAFPVTQAVLRSAQKQKTMAIVKDLQIAVNGYLTEYNRLPVQQGSDADQTPVQTDGSSELIAILMAEESGAGSLNPRGISFFSTNMAKNQRGGLIDGGGSQLQLVDQWGNPYFVLMDANFDNKVRNPDAGNEDQTISSGAPAELRTRVAVWSLGPDGEDGTKDDIVSWR